MSDAIATLKGVAGIGHIAFSNADIVRHALVGRIVAAYDRKGGRAHDQGEMIVSIDIDDAAWLAIDDLESIGTQAAVHCARAADFGTRTCRGDDPVHRRRRRSRS